MIAEEQSYDGTEQTPQPKSFRPPPMHQSRMKGSRMRNNNGQNSSVSVSFPSRTDQEDPPMVNQSLLSSYLDENAFSVDGADESLPSLPMEPPSPIPQPNVSIIEDFSTPREFPTTTPRSLPSFSSSVSRYRSISGKRHFFPPSRIARNNQSQKPPISEVRVETEDDDTFFECIEDRSLAQRTKRSLEIRTPETGGRGALPVDDVSLGPSVTSSVLLAKPELSYAPIARISPTGRELLPSPSAQDMGRVHKNALSALTRLKEELTKANEKNKTLLVELETMQQQSQKRESMWQMEREELQKSSMPSTHHINDRLIALQQEKDTWSKERSELEAKLQTALRERKETAHRKLASDNRQREIRQTLEKTRKELEETIQSQTKLAHDYSIVCREKADVEHEKDRLEKRFNILQQTRENESISKKLQEELDRSSKEISSLKKALDDSREHQQQDFEKQKEDFAKLKEQLAAECEQHKTEADRLRAALKSTLASPQNRITTPGGGSGGYSEVALESSVADRLARMRDSAERAHLIKAHKRDISRIKLSYEQKFQNMTNEHQDTLRKTEKEAESTLADRLQKLRSALKSEFDETLQREQARHQQKFVEAQKKYMRSQEDSDESLQAALSKIANMTHQYEREVSHRGILELSVQQLNKDIEEQRTQLQAQHSKELERRRADWEAERDTLLSVVQRDCNSVFDQQRRNSHTAGTFLSQIGSNSSQNKSQAAGKELFSKLSVETTDVIDGNLNEEVLPLVSPAYSDIDDVLRETEELIQSMM